MKQLATLSAMLSSAKDEEGLTVFDHSAEEIGIEVMEHHGLVLAALIATTIPKSMKPWPGGDTAPADWDRSKAIMFQDGGLSTEEKNNGAFYWDHRFDAGGFAEAGNIIAYTALAEDPATDAAEARARQKFLALLPDGVRFTVEEGIEARCALPSSTIRALIDLATAEAASGAGEREELAAFGASEAAGYQYPGADQTAERAAFCAGAAHAAFLPSATDPATVEFVAKALGLHHCPGGGGSPPTRWPEYPQDTLSARDGTVPIMWEYAEKCRADARVMLAALAAAPTIPATGQDAAASEGAAR